MSLAQTHNPPAPAPSVIVGVTAFAGTFVLALFVGLVIWGRA